MTTHDTLHNYKGKIRRHKIARKVLSWAARYAFTANKEHAPLKKYGEELSGMCAIASARLFRLFQAAGFDCRLVGAQGLTGGHVFVLVGENEIWDVTALQFGYNGVQVRALDQDNPPWYWVPKYWYNDPVELFAAQQQRNWPYEQRVLEKDAVAS